MGYAGCYSLDLYCDNVAPRKADDPLVDAAGHRYGEFPHQYTDEHGSRCRAMAINDGWLFKQDGRVLCPKCSGKQKKEG